MERRKLFDGEYKFMSILWAHEPMTTRDLVAACEAQLGWKRTTTYTVLKKLTDKGFVQTRERVVTALVDRAEAERYESEAVVSQRFGGSLPAFVAAFARGRTLSDEEVAALQALIDAHRGEQGKC